jgi:hypothetical protein
VRFPESVGDAIGLNGGSDEIDLLNRRIESLNKRMLAMVNETIQNGGDIESNEVDFKDISEEIEQLKRRIESIRVSQIGDETLAERLAQIQETIDQREKNKGTYDDAIVRQMVECIQVHKDGKLTIMQAKSNRIHYFYDYGDGWEVSVEVIDAFYPDSLDAQDESIRTAVSSHAPVCIETDGLPVLEDIGGIHGYTDFLLTLHRSQDGIEREETREWARSLGWTGRAIKPKNML